MMDKGGVVADLLFYGMLICLFFLGIATDSIRIADIIYYGGLFCMFLFILALEEGKK